MPSATARYPNPVFRIWVEGRPQSFQKRGALSRYTERIRHAARSVVPRPTESRRVDIEIWFKASHFGRSDVDNVIKPVLDALNGIVYHDDRQVRSVRVVALPTDDAVAIPGWGSTEVWMRFHNAEQREFLINIHEGLALPWGGP